MLGNILDRITKRIHSTGSLILATLGIGYVTTAIEHALPIGKGHGPTHHFYDLYREGLRGMLGEETRA